MGPHGTRELRPPSWLYCDTIIKGSFDQDPAIWYSEDSYAPDGLPPQVAGLGYLRRYRLLLEVIHRLKTDGYFNTVDVDGEVQRLDQNHYGPIDDGPLDFESLLLQKAVQMAVLSYFLVYSRGRALNIPHSFVEWDDELQAYRNQTNVNEGFDDFVPN